MLRDTVGDQHKGDIDALRGTGAGDRYDRDSEARGQKSDGVHPGPPDRIECSMQFGRRQGGCVKENRGGYWLAQMMRCTQATSPRSKL